MTTRLAELLPDIPRWVEARHVVLTQPHEVFGLETNGGLSLALREGGAAGAVFVIGRPSAAAVLAATVGSIGDVVAGPESAAWLSGLLSDWTVEPATLYRPGADLRLPPETDGEVRLSSLAEIERHPTIEADLLEELRDAAASTEIVASFAGGRPVAFCYAGAITETLWDVAIDTVEAFRRQGHAQRVAAFMIRRMARTNRRPVWCAADDNPPSWRLALKLGFVAEDAIVILRPPEGRAS